MEAPSHISTRSFYIRFAKITLQMHTPLSFMPKGGYNVLSYQVLSSATKGLHFGIPHVIEHGGAAMLGASILKASRSVSAKRLDGIG